MREFELFSRILKESTVMIGKVAYSDLRQRFDLPRGNNYIVYSLFPDAVTSVRIMPEKEDKESLKISVGHNIYGKKSDFDVGAAMKRIGGGGHRSVGGASVKKEKAEGIAKRLIDEINAFEAGK
jgi:nanoRNase/pAp phosphatase (c-di-AMP/oligoRNAs hydrolase)